MAGDDFEAMDRPHGHHKEPREPLSDVVRNSFEKVKRDTLLDAGYVQELQQQVPGQLMWLRSSLGLFIQVGLFTVYVGLDCGKTIFNSIALKGDLRIVPQSIPICQAFLQVVLGLSIALSIKGKPALAEVFNLQKILKFLPVSLIFAAAQSFNVLSYTVLSGGTIKILGQVRLLQTALLSKFLLGRSYQLTQWTVIAVIVLAAGNFCLGKEDNKMRWACYQELQEIEANESYSLDSTGIPQACIMGNPDATDNKMQEVQSSMTLGLCYVFTYLILSDLGSLVCERFLKTEEDQPYYIQKTWMEIGSFPCAFILSFLVPLGQSFLGVAEKRWRPQMWWSEHEKCSDPSWASQGTNMNYCGGFFRNWTVAAVIALLLCMSHSFLSGLVVKKLNSVVKLLGKCASLALVFFIGDCWILRKLDPSPICMIAALTVMLATFTFMNLKPSREEKPRDVADGQSTDRQASVEMTQR